MQVDQVQEPALVGETIVNNDDNILLNQISLEQANFQISALIIERGQLADDLKSEREKMRETKLRVERLDALEVKNKNLEATNAHLIHMLGQKDEALKSQLTYLEEFKASLRHKEDIESSEKGKEVLAPSTAELTAKISGLQRIQGLLEQRSKLLKDNSKFKDDDITKLKQELALMLQSLTTKDSKIAELEQKIE